MKKILALILAIALSAACLLVLASCGDCEHVDSNHDGKCDECEEKFCAAHTDTDADNVCDTPYCEKYVACEGHVDANTDNVCDRPYCGMILSVCREHVDADKDGVCDSIGCNVEVVDGLAKTLAAYANSLPTRIYGTTKWDFFEGKEIAYTLRSESNIVTGKVNGLNATVERSFYERLNSVTDIEVVQPVIETVNETKEFLQGSGVRNNAEQGGDWNSAGRNFAPRLGSIAIDLDEDKIISSEYVEGELSNVYTCYIEVTDLKEVFGDNIVIKHNYKADKNGNLPKDSRVKITIVNNGAVVTSITVEINIKAVDNDPAQKIVATTEYSYDVQQVNLIK